MKILKQLNLDDVVFIDIETVPQVPKLKRDTPLWHAWKYKMNHGREPIDGDDPIKLYDEQAALYAEFGKIVVITIGKVKNNKLKLVSYANDDEAQLLMDFTTALNNIIAANKSTVLAGHAIKGFDLPWIMRRCLIYGIPLPSLIDTAHLKPWETTSIDTAELWKGTGFNGGSLIAIAVAFGLVNPKDDMGGWQTGEVYYNEKEGLQRITRYCEKDVLTVANIVRVIRGEELLEPEVVEQLKTTSVGMLNRSFNTGEISKEDAKKLAKIKETLKEEEQKKADEILNIIAGAGAVSAAL